jgi:NAD(P)-dependent dehydrogenase (short-subunit alcohol dehydrogenase family)
MRLADKTAVVTGAAGRNIGRAIAEAFLAEGAKVATIDIRESSQPWPDGEPLALTADVADTDALIAALRRVSLELGTIDVLVNAAAITHRKPFLEVTLDDWDRVHAVDLRAYFVATQWVAQRLVEQGRPGSIVNVASMNATIVTRGQSHYCAAKGGVLQLTRAAAVELAEYGIRVNALSPGVVETDMNRELLADPAFRELRTLPVPLGRIGQPHELAPAAVLLASDESSFITGANIVVDGGQMVC